MSNYRPLAEYERTSLDSGRSTWTEDGAAHIWPSDRLLSNTDNLVLKRTIETLIIPRLLSAHEGPRPRDARISPRDVAAFIKTLWSPEPHAAAAFVEDLAARRVSFDDICLDLFTPAARTFGEYWVADTCDFIDVTIALSRMQQLLREMSGDISGATGGRKQKRRAFLAVMPGDQHTFGLSILREFFSRDGWQTAGGVYASATDLLSAAQQKTFDVVGLSVGSDANLDDVKALLARLKAATGKAKPRVLVGGRVFLERPELVARVGADGTAADARDAVAALATCLT